MKILISANAPWAGCYDEATEVLTRRGWLRFSEILPADEVMTLNPETFRMEWQSPERKVVQYFNSTKQLVRIRNRFLDLLVTPNHSCFVAHRVNSSRKKGWFWTFESAGELLGKHRKFPATGLWSGTKNEYFVLPSLAPDRKWSHAYPERKILIGDWVKFLGYFLSKGWASCSDWEPNLVGIRQKNGKDLEEIAESLRIISRRGRVTYIKDGVIIRDKQLNRYLRQFGKSHDKFVPSEIKELPPELLEIFLRAFESGDSSSRGIQKGVCRSIWTSSSKLRDDLLEIAIKCGYRAAYFLTSEKKHSKQGIFEKNEANRWKISFSKFMQYPGINKYNASDVQLEGYSGKVYCLTVPNRTLLVRRNGKAIFCGNSAYGKMGRYLAKILKELGHEVAYAANWGLSGGILSLDEYDIYPLGQAPWCNDIIDHHAKHFGADLVISIMDIFVLERWGQLLPGRWVAWFPLDGCPANLGDWSKMASAVKAISYSKYGRDEYRRIGFKDVIYIPPGVDTTIFKPLDTTKTLAENKREAKKIIGLDPDLYLVVMVAANSSYPDRKCFAENIEAFVRFHSRHPNSMLYIHTWVTSSMRGVDLSSICTLLNANDCVKFPDAYQYHIGFDESRMATLMNAADVYLGAHGSEGFGVPFIEAMACGTGTILADGTTGPELNVTGWLVPIHHRLWYPLGTWHYRPDIDAIEQYLEESFAADREAIGRKVIEFAQNFDWTVLRDKYWKPLMEELEPHKPVVKLDNAPVITIASLVGPPDENLDRFIDAIRKIDYPQDRINYCFVCHQDSIPKIRNKFPIGHILLEKRVDRRFSMRAKMEIIFNQLLRELSRMSQDYVFYVDADIVSINPDILSDLVSADAGIISPMVFYEQGGESWFYDTVGFVKDGKHFTNQPPFFAGYRYHGNPVPVDFVGSCALIRDEVIRGFEFKFTDLTAFVPLCNRARELGYSVMLSQYQSVIHGFLKNPHTLESWK